MFTNVQEIDINNNLVLDSAPLGRFGQRGPL